MEQAADALNHLDGDRLAAQTAARNNAGSIARVAMAVAVLVAAVLIGHLTFVRAWLGDVAAVRSTVSSLGAWVYPVSVVAFALLVCCGTPRLLLCAVAGSVFGFQIGLGIAVLGTVLGHYSVFLFIRWAGSDWVLHRWPAVRGWVSLVHRRGPAAVILIRQFPAHSMLINVYLGVSPVRHRDFLLGTAIGILPEAIPATLIGAGLVKTSLQDSMGYIGLAVAAVVVLWLVCGRVIRAMRNRATGEMTDGMESQ